MGSDSIIGCSALLKHAEQLCEKTFASWSRIQRIYVDMLDRPADMPIPGAIAIEAARLDCTAAYETLLDAQKLKFDYAVKLRALRAEQEAKRSQRRLPPPGRERA